jgi:hypothetical protein
VVVGTNTLGLQSLIGLGVGRTSALTDMHILLGKSTGTATQYFAALLISNSIQVVYTALKFMYNAVLTAMCAALELEAYSLHPKPLRVSGKREGLQRGRYFLHLPYRFAIPFMLISGLIDWLLSQSLFATSVEMYEYDHDNPSWVKSTTEMPYHTCNYSPLAIVLLSASLALMGAVLLYLSTIRLKSDMPLAANCSAVISAACHPKEGENGRDISLGVVRWGVTGYDVNGIGHCAFSLDPVTGLESGRSYM